jgi:hypothetical protein
MSRGTKTFLMAIGAAILTFLVFMYLVGLSEDYAFTSSGAVDLRDAYSLQKALSDPTFEEGVKWGDVRLASKHVGLLFLLLPTISFALVVIGRILGAKKDVE